MLKFIEIVIFGVYSPSLLASVCFGTFQLFSYFVWLRITDDGSVLEMRIWSILSSLFSYCKNQALTLNTLWGFLQNIYPKHIFRFTGGGLFNFNIYSTLYFHFVIKFRLLLSICGLHLWCPLNLKMLPTPLQLSARPFLVTLGNNKNRNICIRIWFKLTRNYRNDRRTKPQPGSQLGCQLPLLVTLDDEVRVRVETKPSGGFK